MNKGQIVSVKIRLKKLGRRHRPFFRVCVMDTRTRRDGREIEVLGTYDPMVPETDARAMLIGERIDYWLSVGAKPSPKVGTLIQKYGTEGTHLDAQKAALERLGGRRAASITAAVSEAEKTKPVEKAEETAEATENAEATSAEATAAEAAEATETSDAEASADAGATEETTSEESSSEEASDAEASEESSDDAAEENKSDE